MREYLVCLTACCKLFYTAHTVYFWVSCVSTGLATEVWLLLFILFSPQHLLWTWCRDIR